MTNKLILRAVAFDRSTAYYNSLTINTNKILNTMDTLPEYNGFTNKPTWIIHNRILNEQHEQAYWERQMAELLEDDYENAVWELAERMKDHYEDDMYNDEPDNIHNKGMYHWAFAYVDWNGLAKSHLESYKAELEYMNA